MPQISYGSITITDFTDITDIYIQYCMAAASITDAAAIAQKSTWTFPEVGWFKLTTDTTVVADKRYYELSGGIYYIVIPVGNENPSTNHWYEDSPYPTWQSNYQIWKRDVIIKEGIDIPEYGTPYLDTAVSQINTNIINLDNKLKAFFHPGDSSYSGAFAVSKTSETGLDTTDATTYGWNTRVAVGSISMGYNKIPLIELGLLDNGSFNGLKLYSPILTNGVITGNRLDATLDASGLILQKGGIQAGESNQNNFIYLSTVDYPLRQYVKTHDETIEDKNYYIYDDDNNIYVQVINPDVAELENYYELSVEGININGHIPTANTSNDTPWRMIIGNQFGIDANGTLYALGANISGKLNITGGNVYTKEETDLTAENIYNTIDNIENQTIYAYSNNSDGSDYSYTNNILKYRGILVVNSQTDEEIIVPSEKVYEKTLDSQIDETKIYYRLINNEFIAVTTSDQSQINNYYEFIEEHYEKTLDLQIDETKTYYELINNEFVVVEEPVQSEINNYYEFIAAYYTKTSDMFIDETKTYYELVNNKFIIVNNPIQSEINDYYELSIDEQPNKFNWEINPIYAEQNASNYMVNINGGVRIGTSNSNAYLTLNASLMQFWLNRKPMAHFGYDNMYESYGITVENVMITGAGNALRLDNGLNGTYQGQFILETRSNGHLSLKPGLKRNEEEEEI